VPSKVDSNAGTRILGNRKREFKANDLDRRGQGRAKPSLQPIRPGNLAGVNHINFSDLEHGREEKYSHK